MRPLREIEADCARENRRLDWQALRRPLKENPGYRRGQRVCPNPSLPGRKPRDGLGQEPSSGRCGVTRVIQRGRIRKVTWLPCGCLSCPYCGPRLRRQRVDYYARVIGDTPVSARTIARSAWPALRKRLGRAGANYLRFPVRGGFLVLTTIGDGRPVEDLAGWLAGAFDQLEPGGRVSSSRAWALAQGETPSGWELVGISTMRVEEFIEAADDLGLYLGGGRLRWTADDDPRWLAFRTIVGLHRPDHHRWWTGAA
jgi:hypothetical protein